MRAICPKSYQLASPCPSLPYKITFPGRAATDHISIGFLLSDPYLYYTTFHVEKFMAETKIFRAWQVKPRHTIDKGKGSSWGKIVLILYKPKFILNEIPFISYKYL